MKNYYKISDTQGGFTGVIDNSDLFGIAVEGLGDLNGDGTPDVAVNGYLDDDGYPNAGAIWVLFLNSDGSVKSHQKIANSTGGLGNELGNTTTFGNAIENIGDLDGDGVIDLAVGSFLADNGGSNKGLVYILFMNTNGTVKRYQKIGAIDGGFKGPLNTNDFFGGSIANMGDMDGDGIVEIAVGAYNDQDGGSKRGAVWMLFLNADGTVKSEQKISATQGGFTGKLDYDDRFGFGLDCIGDLDLDGVNDMVVGAYADDDGGVNAGAVWILFLNSNGSVKSHQKISMNDGDLSTYVTLSGADVFGIANQYIGNFNGNGDVNLMVAARNDDTGGINKGAVYILDLGTDGKVNGVEKISSLTPGFENQLDPADFFGASIGVVGDVNNDGFIEYAIGTQEMMMEVQIEELYICCRF